MTYFRRLTHPNFPMVSGLYKCGSKISIPENKKILFIGGGTGIAVIKFILQHSIKNKNNVNLLLAFRLKTDIVCLEDFYQIINKKNIFITCDEKNNLFSSKNIFEIIKENKIDFDFIVVSGSIDSISGCIKR